MKFGIFPNLGKKNLFPYLPKLLALLEQKGNTYLLPSVMQEGLEAQGLHSPFGSIDELGHMDAILSIGGDGSFLGAARTFADYPVKMVGIHLGELGFLNSITPEDTEKRIDQIIQGQYVEESRLFLSSVIHHGDGRKKHLTTVLNDIVIGHAKIGQLARINLFVNDHFIQEYAADGLIISSPTGSTGYSLSCGGPVLGPTDDRMIVVPICAHSLQRFPVVLKSSDIVKITVPERENSLSISLDGSESCVFTHTDSLVIQGAQKPIRFLRFPDQDFFGTITQKLVRKICEKQ